MAEIRARGIIIKQSDYGEGHRMLTVFTEEYGIVKAVSYGVKKSKSKAAASSQFLCYGDFDFYKGVGKDIMTINNIDTLDVLEQKRVELDQQINERKKAIGQIAEDIKKLSLCVYLADITYCILGMNNPDSRMLHLFLNSVYALAYRDEPMDKVKAVYELKMMSIGGYSPQLNACVSCGSNEVYAFDLLKGGSVCRACGGKYIVKLDKNLYRALDYIIYSDDKKMLSFNASDGLMKLLCKIAEQYVELQLDQKFSSLDYYKTMLTM